MCYHQTSPIWHLKLNKCFILVLIGFI
ncbi:hypothetical protein RDABS01_018941 [Bienertia sinuspersici]